MSLEAVTDINWLATLVAALAYFALGAVWYARPVFGEAWARTSGVEAQRGDGRLDVIFGPALICLVAAIAVAAVAEATGASGVGDGLGLGLVLGLGLGATMSAMAGMFDDRPERWTWLSIIGGYHLVGLTIVAVLVSVW